MKDAPRAHRIVANSGRDARPEEQQRHVHRCLIEKISMLRFPVIAQPLAVIAGDDDSPPAVRFECGHHPA